ncbi:hypothetical protein QJS04_geneDACA008822 [Acorus gramineus]|uniref:Uncharacterized protein n=1 Tax=Acorus gramineus TaxID=55184 RepID=A0AAV9AEG4_ACOGR|nr:hypothetical protein QJS04_geneDACA008822 [Acorus gramineus]
MGLGKNHPFPFRLTAPPEPTPESEKIGIPTDLDLGNALSGAGAGAPFFVLSDLKNENRDCLFRFSSGWGADATDLDRMNCKAEDLDRWSATDLDRCKGGSLSIRAEIRPTAPISALQPIAAEEDLIRSAEAEAEEKEEEPEEDEEAAEEEEAPQLQGRMWRQSGQRTTRRFLRQLAQTPRPSWEACLRHFHGSSSSLGRNKSIIIAVD